MRLRRLFGHAGRSEYAADALERQIRIAGFDRGRHVRLARRALLAGHHQDLEASGIRQRLRHGERGRQHLDATGQQIARRLHDVAVRHLGHLQALFFEEAEQQKIRNAVRRSGVELARLGPRKRDELSDRVDLHRGRHRHREHDDRDTDDRVHIGRRIERQRIVHVGQGGEGAGRAEPEHMIVLGLSKGAEGDDPVAARPVVHYHRLAPKLAEAVSEQARSRIGSAAGAVRQDEAYSPRRIGRLRRRAADVCQAQHGYRGECYEPSHCNPPCLDRFSRLD